MPSAKLTLRANKSQAYFDSLCKHFARKVNVERTGNSATVAFPMGECHMSVDNDQMLFDASAADQEALEAVKMIIATHAVRFVELKDSLVNWSH